MNFLSNVLDTIPGVGLVKAGAHAIVGDKEGAQKALYQSTRTTAVLAGGAGGCLLGPAGAALGAVYGGLATDLLASGVSGKSQGLVQNCESVANDIRDGKSTTKSFGALGFQLAMDGVGGLGMGGVSNAATQISEKAVANSIQNAGKKVVAAVGEEVLEKTFKVSAQEVTKMITKKASEKVVRKVIEQTVVVAEVALVTAHVENSARKRTEQEEREKEERNERERARRERERRANEERERREREERERRANEERERREREERERRANEERQRREQQERERREREARERMERQTQASATTQQGASQGSESSRQPQGNRNNNNRNNRNNKNNTKKAEKEYFDSFIQLLRRLLQEIYGSEKESISELFAKSRLSQSQRKYLVKVMITLENFDTLEAVVEIVIKIFKDHKPTEIKFENFVSLLEFVRSYINDRLNEIQTESDVHDDLEYDERRAQILRDVRNEQDLVASIVALFDEIAAELNKECEPPNGLCPDFRDIFAKVYHYYKHRRVADLPDYENENIPDEVRPYIPDDGILSVRQYMYWSRVYLAKLKSKDRYRTEVEGAAPPVTCRYEVFVRWFGRRLRIIVKRRDGLVLSSVFFDDACYPDDEDGFERLDIQKK